MDSSELDRMQSRLEKGALRVQRERFPWTPLQVWRTRDTTGNYFPDLDEEIELRLIRDASSVVIFHSSLVASRAEVDYLCRSAALYASQKSSSSGVRAVLCALHVNADAARIASIAKVEIVKVEDDTTAPGAPLRRSPSGRAVDGAPTDNQSKNTSSEAPGKDTSDQLWRNLLLAAGFDAETSETLTQCMTKAGLAFPRNAASIEFDTLKKVPGMKLGQARRIIKHLEGVVA